LNCIEPSDRDNVKKPHKKRFWDSLGKNFVNKIYLLGWAPVPEFRKKIFLDIFYFSHYADGRLALTISP